jgi:hypothetical protein
MAPKDDRIVLLEALAVTAELTGTELSEAAARVMASDLAAYPVPQVLVALTRCRRELKGKLTIAAIIERMDDGRPGPDEAWAMIPMNEDDSCVWTTEMQEAWGIAYPLLQSGDKIGARMAFREAYARLVSNARAEQVAPRWQPSLGHDPSGREPVLEEAVRVGRLPRSVVDRLLTYHKPPDNVALLNAPREKMPEHIRQQLAQTLAHLNATNGRR